MSTQLGTYVNPREHDKEATRKLADIAAAASTAKFIGEVRYGAAVDPRTPGDFAGGRFVADVDEHQGAAAVDVDQLADKIAERLSAGVFQLPDGIAAVLADRNPGLWCNQYPLGAANWDSPWLRYEVRPGGVVVLEIMTADGRRAWGCTLTPAAPPRSSIR